ncbi:4Fe-4S binding protein [Faecalispora anaeroviscerum]|uniref:4Fe-4S binding protein n=1 Tax=Faecalispora anaeroviscerum TaxID=2991836 RepID=UPI0024B9FDAE|nr:4Fe-4S binding protein [Faecalispora anaeroviscerum]
MDKRTWVQALFAFTTNSYVQGFLSGKIYKGKLKNVCVPGLNCYSCPGALGACPIGAMQAVEGSTRYGVSMYVLGFLVFIGILLGRFVCGWLCPFGWLQELLHCIPSPKRKVPKRVNDVLKWLKYGVLLVFVILLPIFTVSEFGLSTPYFCKYICPAGTLEGGIPLLLANESLRSAVGLLFTWKMVILIAVIVASVLIFRPFCRYLCPLGAFYSLFNPISFYRYSVDQTKCTRCGRCAKACKMDIPAFQTPNSLECIRCGACIKACPEQAISCGFGKEKLSQIEQARGK